MQLCDNALQGILAGITETGNIFDPAATYVGVATALTDNGQLTTMTDVTEGTGDLATRQAVTAWGSPYKLVDGRWAVDGPLMSFRVADNTEAQTITNWFLASASTAGTLRGFGLISPPANLPDEFAEWSIVLRLTVDPDGRWSAEITFNG